jgi:membrane associated rhomboid family serine protease
MDNAIPYLTFAVILATSYVTYRGFKTPGLIDRLLFSTGQIRAFKQYYRLLSSALVHTGWTHLLFNMISFYFFARYIEMVFGPVVLAVIYTSSILGGNVLSFYLHKHHEYRAIGASGGVCGVIFASIFLLPGGSVIIFPIPVPIPTSVYAVLFIIITFFGMRSHTGNIGHDAHLGGALVGLAVTAFLYPDIVTRSPVLFSVVVILSVTLLYYFLKRSPSSRLSGRRRRGGLRAVVTEQRERFESKRRETEDKTLAEILDKISSHGMDSLTEEEKRTLEEISRKRRRRDFDE